MPVTDNLPYAFVINDHKQGDTFPGLRFNVTQNGSPKDLTGAAITMTFLHENRRDSEDHVLVIGDGVTIVDAANEIFDMDEIPVVDWKNGKYTCDVEVIYADGQVKTVAEGTWKIVVDKTNNS